MDYLDHMIPKIGNIIHVLLKMLQTSADIPAQDHFTDTSISKNVYSKEMKEVFQYIYVGAHF